AKASFVTAYGSIRNGPTVTSRTGPSPSAGKPSSSSVPIRNVPPSRRIIPSFAADRPAGTASAPAGAPACARPCGSFSPDSFARIGAQQDMMLSSLFTFGNLLAVSSINSVRPSTVQRGADQPRNQNHDDGMRFEFDQCDEGKGKNGKHAHRL